MIDCGCDEILLPQGSNGVDGKNAFTVTTAQFIQPGVGNSVTINVSDSLQNTNQWAIVGQVIKITDSAGNGGWYQVTSITGTTQITATQLDYPGTSGVNILVGAGVSPAGLQGPAGNPGNPGNQGDTGPANSLSIGTVSTLPPGSDATASIIGDAPNQTLLLGIPRGNPGADGNTLVFQSNNSATTTVSGVSYASVVPSSIIDSSAELCPNDGDAFRVVFSCLASYTSKNDNGFNIQIQLGYDNGVFTNVNIERTGTGNSTFEEAVNMWRLPLCSLSTTPSSPKATFKFEMIVHRLTSTTARCCVDFQSNAGFNQKTGVYSTDITYDFASTTIKKIQVNMASAIASETSSVSRWSLLVEKITN